MHACSQMKMFFSLLLLVRVHCINNTTFVTPENIYYGVYVLAIYRVPVDLTLYEIKLQVQGNIIVQIYSNTRELKGHPSTLEYYYRFVS